MDVRVRQAVDADWVEAGRICYEAFATLADRQAISSVHIRSIRELCKDSYSEEEIRVWTSRLNPSRKIFPSIRYLN